MRQKTICLSSGDVLIAVYIVDTANIDDVDDVHIDLSCDHSCHVILRH